MVNEWGMLLNLPRRKIKLTLNLLQTGCSKTTEARGLTPTPEIVTHGGSHACICVSLCVSPGPQCSQMQTAAEQGEEAAAAPKQKLEYLTTWLFLCVHLPSLLWAAFWDLLAKWKTYIWCVTSVDFRPWLCLMCLPSLIAFLHTQLRSMATQ